MNEPVGTEEGRAALREYLKREREKKRASQDLLELLKSAASAFADNTSQQDIEDARQRAREYCEARNKNLRPVRVVDPTNEAAVEGQRSALEFVERRRLSKIRK